MARGFKMFVEFSARDKDLRRKIKGMSAAFADLGERTQRMRGMFGSVFGGFVGANAVMRGIDLVGSGVRSVTTDFLDLDMAVTSAGARFGDMYDRGTRGFTELSAAARKVGADTEHTAAQAASGLTYFAMAGYDAERAMASLPATADFATAANIDFAQATDMATDALGAFRMAGGTAEETGRNLTKIMDQASMASNKANFDLNMWFEAAVEGGNAFAGASQKMETFNAALALMANSGKKGATAGYMLRNMIIRLSSPTAEAQKIMKKLGVSVKDENGNFKDFADILQQFRDGLKGMGTVQSSQILSDVFGARALSGAQILINETDKSFRSMRDTIEDSAGASNNLAEKMRSSLQNRIKKVQSAATEAGMKLFDMAGPQIEEGIKNLTAWLDKVNSGESDLIETLKDGAKGTADFIKFLYEHREQIIAIVKIWGTFKALMLMNSMWNAGKAGIQALSAATGGLNSELLNVNSSLKTMPGILSAVGAAMAGWHIGTAIWNEIEAAQKKMVDLENKYIALTNKASDPSQVPMEDVKSQYGGLKQGFVSYLKDRAISETGIGRASGKNISKEDTASWKALQALKSGDVSALGGLGLKGEMLYKAEALMALDRRIKGAKETGYKNAAAQSTGLEQSDMSLPWYNTQYARYTTENAPSVYEKQEIIHTHKFELPEGVTMKETKTERRPKRTLNPAGAMP